MHKPSPAGRALQGSGSIKPRLINASRRRIIGSSKRKAGGDLYLSNRVMMSLPESLTNIEVGGGLACRLRSAAPIAPGHCGAVLVSPHRNPHLGSCSGRPSLCG